MKNNGLEWVGKIPNDWELIKIKYILQERIEKNSPIKTKNILSLTARQGVIPIAEREGGGNKPKEDFSDYKLAYPGDIVMNSMNILSDSVGLSQYYGCVSPVYYMLRPLNKNFDVRFFNYIFQSTVFQKSLYGLGNGILMKESGNGKLNTIRMRIPMEKFGGLYIPLAPASEQKAIAEFLDKKCGEVDALIADIQQEIETLEQYKRSVITEAVAKGLDPSVPMIDSGIDYLGRINSEWRLTKLGYICQKLNRPVPEKAEALICSNKGKVVLREDVSVGLISENDRMYQGVKVEDLCIHGMDTWHGAIAVSSLNGKITTVVHCCDSREDKRFIAYYLQMLAFKKVYKAISNGVRGNTSDFRSWDKAGDIYIVLPNKETQQQIADYLDKKCKEIEGVIAEKQSQIETLESYKKSLIYEYVTGKKEVG